MSTNSNDDLTDEQTAFKLAQQVRKYKDNMPAMLELLQLEATVSRRRYEELVKNGFTEQQALFLVEP